MRRLLLVAGLVASAGWGVLAATSSADAATRSSGEPATLAQPRAHWLTRSLEAKIVASGIEGYEVTFKRDKPESPGLEPNCLGTAPPYADADDVPPTAVSAVSAGTCMVSPHGCTMNFIFTDGSSQYIGTAGHCVAGGGRTVIAQIATRVDPTDRVTVTLAAIGRVVKAANSGIGRDFALVRIDPGFKVVPGMAGALGPTGVVCGDPVGQPVMHYGHGYVFLVSQGNAKFGEVIPDLTLLVKFKSEEHGFNWVGYGLPGDSGSGVMNAAGLAVGDLTHGIGLAGVPVPGLNFGMTMGGIFDFIGSDYKLVTVDGRRATCESPLGI